MACDSQLPSFWKWQKKGGGGGDSALQPLLFALHIEDTHTIPTTTPQGWLSIMLTAMNLPAQSNYFLLHFFFSPHDLPRNKGPLSTCSLYYFIIQLAIICNPGFNEPQTFHLQYAYLSLQSCILLEHFRRKTNSKAECTAYWREAQIRAKQPGSLWMRCDCMHELYVQHGNSIMRHVPFILNVTRRKSSMVMDALNERRKKNTEN